jgi:hypothetical protein
VDARLSQLPGDFETDAFVGARNERQARRRGLHAMEILVDEWLEETCVCISL